MNTSPNSSWFYSQDREKKGPVPFSELQVLLVDTLPKDTLVWTDGMADWVPAHTIPAISQSNLSADDTGNPYAPPSSGNPTPGLEGSLELGEIPANPVPLDIGFCISQAWKYTKANLGRLFVLGLVYFILSSVVSGVLVTVATMIEGGPPASDNPFDPQPYNGPLTVGADLIGQIFSMFLTLGAISYGHKLLKGELPEVNDLFSQGSKLITAIGATIVFALAVLFGLVLLIIPGIYFALRLGLYQQAIVEKNLGAIDSLKYSWALTKGNVFPILGLYILGALIVIAGILALVIGLIWALPVAWLSSIIAFRYLHGGPQTIKEIQ